VCALLIVGVMAFFFIRGKSRESVSNREEYQRVQTSF